MHENKMGIMKMSKLLWVMGLPMILSMILQAIYNVVDTVFVVNREGLGQIANQALTFAFPVQIFMIAIGVGTGVGINAMLSKSLGEGSGQQGMRKWHRTGNHHHPRLCPLRPLRGQPVYAVHGKERR